jgi:hypothetical protein
MNADFLGQSRLQHPVAQTRNEQHRHRHRDRKSRLRQGRSGDLLPRAARGLNGVGQGIERGALFLFPMDYR